LAQHRLGLEGTTAQAAVSGRKAEIMGFFKLALMALVGEGAPERGAGSAQRGAGSRLRCDRGADHGRVTADPLHVCGVRSQRVPLPPCDAPRLRDATAKAHISTCSPLLAPAAGNGGAWSRDRRNAEQGSRLRDATVEPIMSASSPILARLRGLIPRGAPLPPSDAPTCGDATVEPFICASPPFLCAPSRSDPRGSRFRATTRTSIGKPMEPVPPLACAGDEGLSVRHLCESSVVQYDNTRAL
jgi:hypothetical protein